MVKMCYQNAAGNSFHAYPKQLHEIRAKLLFDRSAFKKPGYK